MRKSNGSPGNSGGMEVAAQPEAVEAGVNAIRAGGNAVDAAIVCALVAGVVDPQMCGIAGFGNAQIYLPDAGVHQCVDFHGTSPAATRADMWEHLLVGETRDGFGFLLEGNVNDIGYQSITTPGSLLAYYEAQTRYGQLDWADVVAPAIEWAERGFAIRPAVHAWWTGGAIMGRVDAVERLRLTESGRAIYFHEDGRLRSVGETLKNPDLGRTLRRIAEGGADVFYSDDLAQEIEADMRTNGGLLSADDLADYRTVWGDPAFVDVPLARLLSPEYAESVANRIRAGERAQVQRIKGEPPDTTHVSVIDGDGNAVTMTHSLGMPSGVITPGLGFMFNGCMGVFDPRPGRTGSLAPGKRRFTSLCPTMVFRNGTLDMVLGAPGGTQIAMTVTQALLNRMEFGMNVVDAVIAPRFSATSNAIDVCNRIPRAVTDELDGDGYEVIRWPQSYAFALIHAIAVTDDGLKGAADPGGDGMALSV